MATETTQNNTQMDSNWFNLLLLRPYGSETLTPKVKFWLGSSLIVIMIMSALEGLVWGLISSHLVPEADENIGLKHTINAIVSVAIFCIIWIADTSLIVFEPKPKTNSTKKIHWGFIAGLVSRMVIIGVSLYVTAPMLEQVIRDKDIFDRITAEQTRVRDEFIKLKEKDLASKTQSLKERENSVKNLIEASSPEQKNYDKQKEQLERQKAEYEEQIKKFQEQVDLEFNGDGKKILPGPGPRYEYYVKQRDRYQKMADNLLVEMRKLKLPTEVNPQSAKLKTIVDELVDAQKIHNKSIEQIKKMKLDAFEKAYKTQLTEPFPKNTPGYRIKILNEIKTEEKEADKEHLVGYFDTTQGIAKALLLVLFSSLLALKFFEPEEVRRYFNEDLQDAWRSYKQNKLDELPGFQNFKHQITSYASFVEGWNKYQIEAPQYIAQYKQLEHKLEIQRLENQLTTNIQQAALINEQYQKEHENKLKILEFELEQATKNKEIEAKLRQEERELANKRLDAELEQIRIEKETEVKLRQDERELAKKRLENEIEQERTLFEQEMANHKAELAREQQRLEVELEQNQHELNLRAQRMEKEMANELVKIDAVKEQRQYEMRLKENAARIDQILQEISRIETEKTPLKNELGNLEHQLESKNTLANLQSQEVEKNGLEPQRLYQNLEKKKKLLNDAYDNVNRLNLDDDVTEQAKEDAQKAVTKRKNELKEAKEQFEKSSNHESEPLLKLNKTRQEIAEITYQKNACQAKLQGLEAELDKWRELRRQLVMMEEKHG